MPSHRGRAEVIQRNFALLEDQHPTIETVVAQGEQVVFVGREKGRVRATGRPYDLHLVQVYTFRNGKLVNMHQVLDTAAWISAAGEGEMALPD